MAVRSGAPERPRSSFYVLAVVTVAAVAAISVGACTDGGAKEPDPTGPTTTPVGSVRLSIQAATLAKGQTFKFDATPLDASGSALAGRSVTWSVADPGKGSIDGAGNVTGLAAGSTTVTATSEGKSANATVSVLAFATIQPGMLKTCALTTSGVLYCAGNDTNGLARPEGGAIRFNDISSHSEPEGSTVAHYCGLTSDGTAYCWGTNGFGELGTGDTNSRGTPTAVAGGLKFQSITPGQHHTCAISTAGDAYCWGEGASGVIGNGGTVSSSQPVAVSGVPKFTQIESGNFHVCALAVDGQAWCWGRNHLAQLGRGSSGDPVAIPAPVAGSVRFRSLGIKWTWSCGLTALGAAHCWGDNTLGQVGSTTTNVCDGDKPCAFSPSPVAGNLTFSSIAASQFSTCGIGTDGQVYCWGGDMQNQFGAATPPSGCGVSGFAFGCTNVPTRGPSGYSTLRGSPRNYCGLTDGVARCWGGNNIKQIGNPAVTVMTSTPVVFSIDPASAP